MSWGFRRRIRLGPISLNLSKKGVSAGAKVGPASVNSRTRRLRIRLPFGAWWTSKRRR